MKRRVKKKQISVIQFLQFWRNFAKFTALIDDMKLMFEEERKHIKNNFDKSKTE